MAINWGAQQNIITAFSWLSFRCGSRRSPTLSNLLSLSSFVSPSKEIRWMGRLKNRDARFDLSKSPISSHLTNETFRFQKLISVKCDEQKLDGKPKMVSPLLSLFTFLISFQRKMQNLRLLASHYNEELSQLGNFHDNQMWFLPLQRATRIRERHSLICNHSVVTLNLFVFWRFVNCVGWN